MKSKKRKNHVYSLGFIIERLFSDPEIIASVVRGNKKRKIPKNEKKKTGKTYVVVIYWQRSSVGQCFLKHWTC